MTGRFLGRRCSTSPVTARYLPVIGHACDSSDTGAAEAHVATMFSHTIIRLHSTPTRSWISLSTRRCPGPTRPAWRPLYRDRDRYITGTDRVSKEKPGCRRRRLPLWLLRSRPFSGHRPTGGDRRLRTAAPRVRIACSIVAVSDSHSSSRASSSMTLHARLAARSQQPS
jgi:hypothetical protein